MKIMMRMMMRFLGVIQSLLLLSWGLNVAAKSGYMLTFPQKIQLDARESLCFTFYNVTGDVQVNLTLSCYGEEKWLEPSSFLKGKDGCVKWEIPGDLTPGTCKLAVSGFSEMDNYTFSDQHDVDLVDTHQVSFIQTDRPVYKPGQTVKIRILTITQDLKPVADQISSVAVLDPHDFHMKEWTSLPVSSGLASLEFKISKEPVLGDWTIVTVVNNRKTEQTFTIEKYVLPRFQLTMDLPQILTVDTNSLHFEVCAKYTYGKPVSGFLNANVCLNNTESSWYCEQNKRPCVNVTAEVNGCHSFYVSTEKLNLTSRTYSLLCRPHLSLVSSLTEKHTGITVEEAKTGPRVWQEKVKLRFISPGHFKPYFPYHGKLEVTYPDGSPVSGETIVVKIPQLRVEEELTSNPSGHVTFTLTNLTRSSGFFLMTAETKDDIDIDQKLYTIYAATTKKHVKQWYSPSLTYLDVSSNGFHPLTCGQVLYLNMSYSKLPETDIQKMFYQVVSKGNTLYVEDITRWLSKSGPYVAQVKGQELQSRPVPTTDTPLLIDTAEEASNGNGNTPLGPPGWSQDTPLGPPGSPGSRGPVVPPVGPPRPLPNFDESPTQLDNEQTGDEEDKPAPYLQQFTYPVTVKMSMVPRVRILVYMVTSEGEVVADTIDFVVNPCFTNMVNMEFADTEVNPDSQTSLTLTAHPGSLCSVTMVDKSVHLHSNNNLLQRSKLTEKLDTYDVSSSFIADWQYCSDNSDMPPFVLTPPVGPPLFPGSMPGEEDGLPPPGGWIGAPFPAGRRRRSIMQYYSNMYDSLLAFRVSGLVAVTDLDLQTRPCLHSGQFSPPYHPGDPRGPIPGPGGVLPGEEVEEETALPVVSTLRDYFPETWLWELQEIPSTGQLKLNESLPHTITQWVGSTFCTSTEAGLGASDIVNITTFQPFFLDVSLPYSVIRGETVAMTVTVFNYLPHCAAFQLNLTETQEFELVGEDSQDNEPQSCICGGDAWTFTFRLKPRLLGALNIMVKATLREHRVSCRSVDKPPGYQGNQFSDTVLRQLHVEAEGVQVEKTKSLYICPQDTNHKFKSTLVPDIPVDAVVPGSLRGWIRVIGDIMGPVLSGLDHLVQLPTGCGEQNVLRLAPNIAVLQYLEPTGQLTHEIETKVMDHMEEGYQEQMKFMRSDGSYSAFGEADEHGSTWLSAFVFKTFRYAMDYIYIDRKDVQIKTWNFLVSMQGANGCFQEDGKVLSKYMQGGVLGGDNFDKTLTAYVLVAMIESFPIMRENTPPFIALAVKCIEVDNLEDPYTLALTTYAMVLYKPDSAYTNMLMEKLMMKVKSDGDTMHWERLHLANKTRSRRAPSAEIEMTAYALLAILNKDKTAPISDVIPIVRWLTQQRNDLGGFSSTQDTVVALQALSQFARRVHGEGLDVSISVSDDLGATLDFLVSHSNSLLLQQQNIRHVDKSQHIAAKGDGCIMLQSTVRYNMQNVVLPKPAFSFTVTTPINEQQLDNCRSRIVRVCASYMEPDKESNMAIIEVRMVSGWIPDGTSLERLMNYVDLGLKKYEMDYRNPDVVDFYFNQLREKETCFEFNVVLEVEVEDQKPVVARIYDYYETDMEATTLYELSPCTRAELEADDISIDSDLTFEGSAATDITDDTETNDNQTEEEKEDEMNRSFAQPGPPGQISTVDSDEDITTVLATVGSRVVLSCSFENIGPKTVVWKKRSDSFPLTVGTTTFTSEERISVDRTRSFEGQWNLVISDVMLDDAGVYECILTGSTERKQEVTLEVKNTTSTEDSDEDIGTVSATVGSRVVLSCSFENIGTQTVVWKKLPYSIPFTEGRLTITSDERISVDSTGISEGQRNLVISDVMLDDAGVYECIMYTSGRNVQKQEVTLEVKNTTSTEDSDEDIRTVSATVGSNVVLPCSFENVGTKTLVWKKRSSSTPLTVGRMTFTPDERISVDSTRMYDGQWNLVISDVKLDDLGVYECILSGRVTRKQEVTLVVKESPARREIFISGPKSVQLGETLTLICNATEPFPRSQTLAWFRQGTQLTTNIENGVEITQQYFPEQHTTSSKLTIKRVTWQDGDRYICRTDSLHVISKEVQVVNEPTTSSSSSDDDTVTVQGVIGYLVTLPCVFEESGTRTVLWRRDDSDFPLTIGTVTFTPDGRVNVNHTTSDGEWNLIISDVKMSDVGVYECTLLGDVPVKRRVTLEVTGSPARREIFISGPKSVQLGETLTLICNATEPFHGRQYLDWFREGKRLRTNIENGVEITQQYFPEQNTTSSKLTIQRVTWQDGDTYVCRTDSIQVTSKDVQVVNESPARREIFISGPKSVQLGETLTLICNATKPFPVSDDMQWFIRGERLTTNLENGVEITQQYFPKQHTTSSKLTIQRVTWQDGDTYVCRTDSLQVTSTEVQVVNEPTPSSSSSDDDTVTVQGVIGHLVTLPCVFEESGKVSWRKDDSDFPLTIGTVTFTPDGRVNVNYTTSDGEWNLIISYVKMSDAGVYECTLLGDVPVKRRVTLEVTEVTPSSYINNSDTAAAGHQGPSCPICVLTGTVNILDRICEYQVLLVTLADGQYDIHIISGSTVSPKITTPIPDIMLQCNPCHSIFFNTGDKAIVFTGMNSPDLGLSIANSDSVVIPWSQSLQRVIQISQSRCVI